MRWTLILLPVYGVVLLDGMSSTIFVQQLKNLLSAFWNRPILEALIRMMVVITMGDALVIAHPGFITGFDSPKIHSISLMA